MKRKRWTATYNCDSKGGTRSSSARSISVDPIRGNIDLRIDSLVGRLGFLPPRALDLLEVAAYTYAADRMTTRGRTDVVDYGAWSRRIRLNIGVRDPAFWRSEGPSELLASAVEFMTGDEEFKYSFQAGPTVRALSLFDSPEFEPPVPDRPVAVTAFSGGLDSLAGVIDLLSNSDTSVILASHQSSNGTKRTQRQLAAALKERWPGRVSLCPLECNLRLNRAPEESQRTRALLYSALAAAIANSYSASRIIFFENGFTSINLPRRGDQLNARASRTTHPQTMGRLSMFLSSLFDREIRIELPFATKTKSEVLEVLARTGHADLISSAVSCSAMLQRRGEATHCGECFQCIDRRLAAYASEVETFDHRGLYSLDVTRDAIVAPRTRTVLIDYLRQAINFQGASEMALLSQHLAELAEIDRWAPFDGPDRQVLDEVLSLCHRHGDAVVRGLKRIQLLNEDLAAQRSENSLLEVIGRREYLREDRDRLAARVLEVVDASMSPLLRRVRPANENDLNRQIHATLIAAGERIRSEFPIASFACGRVIPDHELENQDVIVEAKFIRDGTPPSRASEGMAADLTKYPAKAMILFVVVDLDNQIADRSQFRRDFEKAGRAKVLII